MRPFGVRFLNIPRSIPAGRGDCNVGSRRRDDRNRRAGRSVGAGVAPARHRCVSPYDRSPLRGPREVRARARRSDEQRKADPASHPEKRRRGRSHVRRPAPDRHAGHRAAAPEAARPDRARAGGRQEPRPRHRIRAAHGFLPGDHRAHSGERRRREGDRSADPHGQDQFRAVHQAQQESAGRDAGLGRADRGTGQASRYGRLASVRQDRGPPGAAGNAEHGRAARKSAVADRIRDRRASGRAQDQQPRQAPDGEDAARVLFERAAQGDPEGAGRRRGRPRRAERSRRAHPQDQAVEGSAREGAGRSAASCARCRR